MPNRTMAGLIAVTLLAACTGDDDAGDTTTAASPAATQTTAATPTSTVIDIAPPPASGPATSAPATSAPDDGSYEATIRRTTDGIPHISGESYADVVFGQGYANATDHACSLADQVLKVQGRRAAAFGRGTDGQNVESDFAWLAIGIDERARADFEQAPDDIVEMFDAFAAGWNHHLDEVGAEGLIGWCAGEEWVEPLTGADIYAYARSVALLASSGAITDFIASAQPPAPASATPPTSAPPASGLIRPENIGSNGWAIGTDSVTGGEGGMLVANPHFPWEGELRFWEVHLTVPGEVDIYGAMLLGLPGIGIGFTDEFAWTHTVSAGHRFTAYTLDLDPADPTSYLVDGESRAMTSRDVAVDVRRRDGSMATETRTMWSSEYGPIINFPGLGWTAEQTLTFRDANIDNEESTEQYMAMNKAKSFDEFVDAHRQHQGIPLFNTIAVSRDGRAWYADTSATPNLSRRAERRYRRALRDDPITSIAADNGAVLLDGSDSTFVWEEVDGARDPGLVPFDELPMVERSDYVFNANDSFWMPHATEMLEGGYSILHGEQRTERSLRTRENAIVLSGSRPDRPAGDDGTFTAEELRDAALHNAAGSARFMLDGLMGNCHLIAVDMIVAAPELLADDGSVALAAETVDIAPACNVLRQWDRRFDLDSRGAVLWREFLAAFRRELGGSLEGVGTFDPENPVETPSVFVPGPGDPGPPPPGRVPSPTAIALARAVQTLAKAGIDIDAPLGDVQYALRATPRIPIHGGPGGDGITNVVGYSDPSGTSEPMPDPGEPVVPGSSLRPDGYPVDTGTSFVMTVDYSSGEPQAWAILTYGETGDRDSPLFTVQTQRFSDKNWREVAFTEEAIAADPELVELTVSGE
jgi:acyl-homoserine-lactone acylase